MLNKTEILEALFNNIVTVTFTKVNGDERVMSCTLQEKYLPEGTGSIEPKVQSAQSVWDIKAEGWRSFRWDNVKGWEIESA